MGRATRCHYCPPLVTGMWLSVGILVLLLSGGCRRGVPALDPAGTPQDVQQYRSGTPERVKEPLLKRPVRAARPRGPAYRLDNGLGSPIT